MSKYMVVRMYRDDENLTEIVKRNLTLEQAQEHCRDPETSSSTCTSAEGKKRTAQKGPWFDGYEEQGR